jgi:hypothetical protein
MSAQRFKVGYRVKVKSQRFKVGYRVKVKSGMLKIASDNGVPLEVYAEMAGKEFIVEDSVTDPYDYRINGWWFPDEMLEPVTRGIEDVKAGSRETMPTDELRKELARLILSIANRAYDSCVKGQAMLSVEWEKCFTDYFIKLFDREKAKEREKLKSKIGFLRQWLNEDRITDPSKMVTNEDIESRLKDYYET